MSTNRLYKYLDSNYNLVNLINKTSDTYKVEGLVGYKGIVRILDIIVEYVNNNDFALDTLHPNNTIIPNDKIAIVKKSFSEEQVSSTRALKVYDTIDYIFYKMSLFIEDSKKGYSKFQEAQQQSIKLDYNNTYGQNLDLIMYLVLYQDLPKALRNNIKKAISIDDSVESTVLALCNNNIILKDDICSLKMESIKKKEGTLSLLVIMNTLRPFSKRRPSLLS